MKHQQTITGIDIGTHAIRIVVGTPLENGTYQIIGVGDAPSRGVTKGMITDLEETVTSLSEAIEKAERMIGGQLSQVVVGVNGSHVRVVHSQGVVAVGKPNGEVQPSDVQRAVEQSQAVAAAPNYEILHIIPKFFNLDNQLHLKDPLGMTGIKLEAHTQVILGLGSQVKNLTKCMYRTQLDVEGMVFSPLACAQAVLSKRQRDLGVALVNIGGGTTSVAVYEEGDLLHAAVIPLGSDHVTADLAIGLRVAMEIAERVKQDHETIVASKVSKRDEIDVAKYSAEEMPRTMISKKMIAEIIEARLREIFSLVNQELAKVGKAKKLPAGIVLTGGGSRQQGILDFAKEELKLPVFLGSVDSVFTPIDKVKEPEFSTAFGLVTYSEGEPMHERQSTFGFLSRATDAITRRLRGLLP